MYLNPSEADVAIYFLERVAPRGLKEEKMLGTVIDVLKKGFRHDVFGDVPTVNQNRAIISQDI